MKKRFFPPLLLVFMLCQILLSFSKVYADELIYQNVNKRDPFVPLVSANGEVKKSMDSSGWVVEGIIYDPKQDSVAIINGEFYRVGDKIGESAIKKIERDHVILTSEDEEIKLWLIDENLIKEGDFYEQRTHVAQSSNPKK